MLSNGRGDRTLQSLTTHVIGGAWGKAPGELDVEVVAFGTTAFLGGATVLDPSSGTRRSVSTLQYEKRRILDGDIILEVSGGSPTQPVGRVLIADGDLPNVIPSSFMRLVRFDPNEILPKYALLVFQWLYQSGVSAACQSNTTGIRNLNVPMYLQTRISLPSIADQRRAIDLVGAVDAAVSASKAQEVAITSLRAAHVAGGADDKVSLPISELADVSQGKPLSREYQGSVAGDIPWFKIADMTAPSNLDGYYAAATSMSPEQIAERGGRVVPVGSVVFPRVGAAVLTEKKRIMDVAGAVDENHLILTPKEGTHPEFLLGVMESVKLSHLVQSGAVPSLNMALIRKMTVQWPRADKQSEVGEILGALRMSLSRVRKLSESLRALRVEVLNALLSGEHRIPEAYDELMGA